MKQTLRRAWGQAKAPKNRPFLVTLAVLAGLPILILFWLVATKSVNAPFWDQWIYADLLHKLQNGTLVFHDVWGQHNEHRIFFPKIILLAVATVTQWNVRFEVLMNFAAMAGAYGLLLVMLWRTFKNRAFFIAAAATAAWLLFSPLAYINWIWGFQFAWYFSVFSLVLAIWALYRNQSSKKLDAWFWVAVAGAILCNYSMGNGLLVWFAGTAMLLSYGAAKNKLIAWHSIAVGAIAIYFYHFHLEGGGLSAVLHRPIDAMHYVLQYIGHPLGANPGTALMAGIILLVLAAGSFYVLFRKKQLVRAAPWIGLASYGLLTAFMAAASRMGPFGVDHSMSFSYTTISVLFTTGTLVMVILATELSLRSILRWKPKYLLAAGGMVGLIAYPIGTAYVENYFTGVQKMTEQSDHLKKARTCIYNVQSPADPCLLTTFPNKDEAFKKIQYLKEMHWGNF